MDLVQVSNLIVCPKCKVKTGKTWSHWTTTESKNIIKSHVAFECFQCGYQFKVMDKKLIEFVVREMHWKEGYFGEDDWDEEEYDDD